MDEGIYEQYLDSYQETLAIFLLADPYFNPPSSLSRVQHSTTATDSYIVCKPTPACFLPSTKATGGVYAFLPWTM